MPGAKSSQLHRRNSARPNRVKERFIAPVVIAGTYEINYAGARPGRAAREGYK